MYEVVVSPEAEADLDRIIRYIAANLRNPPAVTALADKIEASAKMRSSVPWDTVAPKLETTRSYTALTRPPNVF